MTVENPHAKLTDEVRAAMANQGLMPRGDDPPPVPEGYVRYLVAVGEDHHAEGLSNRPTVAAILRSVADQLDPPKPTMRSTT